MSEFTAKASTNYTEDMISVMEANYSANRSEERRVGNGSRVQG